MKVWKKIYSNWMKFSEILGKISSTIILTIMFFLIITPTAFVLKLLGKDPLSKLQFKKRQSYWIDRAEQPGTTLNQY